MLVGLDGAHKRHTLGVVEVRVASWAMTGVWKIDPDRVVACRTLTITARAGDPQKVTKAGLARFFCGEVGGGADRNQKGCGVNIQMRIYH